MSTEARAFAAGYAAAIKMLTPIESTPGWGARYLELVPDLFESWQLSQNEEFQESIAQMLRGEGRTISPVEFDERSRNVSVSKIVTWDWKDPDPVEHVAKAVLEVSDGAIRVYEIDTGSDQIAVLVSDTELNDSQVAEMYQHWQGGHDS